MNVLYIGSFRLPNFDAAAARVLNIARALREAGHQVSFISWGGSERDEDKGKDGVFRADGFPYKVTNELPQPGLSFYEKLRIRLHQGKTTKRLLKEGLESIDVIITYNNCLCRWLIPFCKKRGIKLINDITEWYEYNELKPTDWMGYAYDMHIIQKRVKNKIVISSYLERFYQSTNNIVIPATCDSTEKKWQQVSDVVKLNVGEYDGITLIYAGNPARKDAVHYVINAVNTLAQEGAKVRFLIIGITKAQYIERYNDLLKEKELNDSIKFLGRVSQDEVPSYYAFSDFMVLLRESNRKSNAGFPTKFSESFTSGTPVIANLTSDIGLYLKDGETGYVVEEPSENSIYRILKKRVLPLSRIEIEKMKQNVMVVSRQLDYHAYIGPLCEFMKNLK